LIDCLIVFKRTPSLDLFEFNECHKNTISDRIKEDYLRIHFFRVLKVLAKNHKGESREEVNDWLPNENKTGKRYDQDRSSPKKAFCINFLVPLAVDALAVRIYPIAISEFNQSNALVTAKNVIGMTYTTEKSLHHDLHHISTHTHTKV
jgi:hypothetical protein